MARKTPTPIVHFTHLQNLPGIIRSGLQSDATCRRGGLTEVEVGDLSIRERRLELPVDVGPGGFVGDYVPFYFAPKSPMMFVLRKNDSSFRLACDSGDIIYLATTLESVMADGRSWVASNRNAALALAGFIDNLSDLEDHVSWDVIYASYWKDFPDGKDRRMAELLIHDQLPWDAVRAIVVRSDAAKARVEAVLGATSHVPQVIVRRGWYF